jgi:RNA polymerase sigma factor (sigma-70 family)
MKKLSSREEQKVMHQFDAYSKRILSQEVINYQRKLDYLWKHEISLYELSQKEMEELVTIDEYDIDTFHYQILGYDIQVRDTLLAEALESLSERKRDVVLLSYYMEMSDAQIAGELKLMRCTVYAHRTRALKIMRKFMEEKADEDG